MQLNHDTDIDTYAFTRVMNYKSRWHVYKIVHMQFPCLVINADARLTRLQGPETMQYCKNRIRIRQNRNATPARVDLCPMQNACAPYFTRMNEMLGCTRITCMCANMIEGNMWPRDWPCMFDIGIVCNRDDFSSINFDTESHFGGWEPWSWYLWGEFLVSVCLGNMHFAISHSNDNFFSVLCSLRFIILSHTIVDYDAINYTNCNLWRK